MITSMGSAQVKHVLLLQKKSKARKESGEFVVEGTKMVLEAPKDRLVKIYTAESYINGNSSFLSHFEDNIGIVEVVSDNVFAKMSDTQTPQGVMAIVKFPEYKLDDILSDNAFIIGVENLQDPGNLGTIIRMSEAAGVSGVVISSNSVDMYNPKTIRSTMGSIYRVKYVVVDDFIDTFEYIKKKGVTVYAAHLDGNINYTDANYSGKTAFLIGNEGNGLTDRAAETADVLIKIPMEGEVESLNAAIACTVLSFEAKRQRMLKY